MKKIPYREAVGSLIFASQQTRPDICFAVNNVAKFCNNPGPAHWQAVKRIFRYLKGTSQVRLEYRKDGNNSITGYSDSDWGSSEDDRRSVTGYVFLMSNGMISWNSKRQATVALSSTEAEYMALSSATQEALWWRNIEKELNYGESKKPTTIFGDNVGALQLGTNGGYHPRTKHIDIRHHFVHEKVENSEIQLQYVPSELMVADALTKPAKDVKRLREQFNIKIV